MGKLTDMLAYGGISEREFAGIRHEIQEKNRKVLALIGSLAAVSFLGIFLIGLLAGSGTILTGTQKLYAELGLFSAAVTATALWILPRHRHMTLGVCYAYLCVVFCFAIWAGTFGQPEYPATTFCVLLVALPLMIVERPLRIGLYTIGVSIMFLLSAATCKKGAVMEVDLLNCLCFTFLSMTVGTTMNHARVRELAQRKVIERQRDTDQLSSLLNKAAFSREMELVTEDRTPGALLVIDIDNFKHFNDTYGHIFGDAVIRNVAANISKMFSEDALTGRFGGDEFVVYQMGNLTDHEVVRRAALLRHALSHDAELPEQVDRVTVSIGLVFSPGGVAYKSLFASADKALYQAKHEGKNRSCVSQDVHWEKEESDDGSQSVLRKLLSRFFGRRS